jgi:hypothetical protein
MWWSKIVPIVDFWTGRESKSPPGHPTSTSAFLSFVKPEDRRMFLWDELVPRIYDLITTSIGVIKRLITTAR